MEYIPESIQAYAERYTTPQPDVFDRLGEETRATRPNAEMMVGGHEGAFLSFLVTMKQPRRVLEIGTFTGWSSIAMARALPPGGTIVSCDVNAETTDVARRYAEEAGVADRIEYRVGNGLELIAGLEGPFDLVFIDADKESYVEYYEAALAKLAPDGIIAADNTLFGINDTEIGRSMQRFNDHVRDDERVESVLVTVREGVTLIRRRA
ncbi:MAG TPA: O-methyltransferase [Gaiellaceae bacterium]|jgi:caffeoyl-CoA O-methyltransferase